MIARQTYRLGPRFARHTSIRQRIFRFTTTTGALFLCAISSLANEARHLTLTEAVQLALQQNRTLKIARFKVQENEHRKEAARSDYLPTITNQSNILHITELENLSVPAGAFGVAASVPIPNSGTQLPQGKKTLFSSGTMLAQPLTQLLRIRQENRVAAAEVATSHDDLKNAENEVALQVHSLYYAILVVQLQKKAAEQQTSFATENLRDNENDVRKGSSLQVTAIQSRAELLQGQQSVLTAELQIDDYTTEMNDLLGLPLDTKLELDPEVEANFETLPKDEYVKEAWEENPEIHDGVPFLVRNFGDFGIHLNYTLWDFGKRRATVRERSSQLAEAEEQLEHLKEKVAVAVDRSYNKLERTKSMVNVASQVAELRQESERLATNQAAQGVVLISDVRHATAAHYEANAELLQARLGYLLAWAELERTVGRAPGLGTP